MTFVIFLLDRCTSSDYSHNTYMEHRTMWYNRWIPLICQDAKIYIFPYTSKLLCYFFDLYSGKRVFKNSSLITRNSVSCSDIEDYSVDSPYTTRHHTHHPNHCILLRMWILYVQFTLSPLVTRFEVTSESILQLVLYQDDILYEGDEWVMSEVKWITAVILWCTCYYSVMGDELTSSVKFLFFFL